MRGCNKAAVGAEPVGSPLVGAGFVPLAFIGLRSIWLVYASCSVVERDPGKVSGSWVFRDTRVLVVARFENLEGGASIDDFLSWFPGVKREQVEAIIANLRPGDYEEIFIP